MFNTLLDAQRWIESIHRFGDKYDLSRMEKACAMLEHPEKSFKSIHIGGTNGKGSTLTYIKQIYIEAGLNVSTYTSPYVVRFNERMTYNNEEISDEELLAYINKIYEFNQHYQEVEHDQITFFELVTLISFLYFKDKQPDIALIEVGLGGTLDATNVITPIASVITTIGYDHMHVLGDTLEAIAGNKLGIVKPNIPLMTGVEQESLYALFKDKAESLGCDFYHLDDHPISDIRLGIPSTFNFMDTQFAINMAGIHQVRNAALAILTVLSLHEMNRLTLDTSVLPKGLKNAFWPGRFEVFGNVIIDGAHNKEGLRACLNTVKAYYPNHKVTALFTVMKDKDYRPMLTMLEEVDQVIFTEIDQPRCEEAKQLHDISQHPNKSYDQDFIHALNTHKPNHELELLIVTGSLYFISEIRKQLKNQSL